jgi:hypothetical protein
VVCHSPVVPVLQYLVACSVEIYHGFKLKTRVRQGKARKADHLVKLLTPRSSRKVIVVVECFNKAFQVSPEEDVDRSGGAVVKTGPELQPLRSNILTRRIKGSERYTIGAHSVPVCPLPGPIRRQPCKLRLQ